MPLQPHLHMGCVIGMVSSIRQAPRDTLRGLSSMPDYSLPLMIRRGAIGVILAKRDYSVKQIYFLPSEDGLMAKKIKEVLDHVSYACNRC